MKQKAMELKLVVRPIVGCLTHSHFWEGPCRAGHLEDMTPEAEKKAADRNTSLPFTFLDASALMLALHDTPDVSTGSPPRCNSFITRIL